MQKRAKLSSYTKIIIAVSLFLFVADALLGSILIIRTVDRMKRVIQGKIMEIALSAANLLNGDEIKALTYEDMENETEPYKKNYDVLAAFKTSSIDNNAELAYIYCLVELDDGSIVFSIDPSDEPGEFLVEETIRTNALVAAFDGIAGFDTDSYVDRWGDLYSAYAPIYGNDGTVKAVVGVDVWASWYKQEIYSSVLLISIIMVATIGIGLLSAVVLVRRIRKKIDVLKLEMTDLNGDVDKLLLDANIAKKEEGVDFGIDDNPNDHLTQLRGQIHTAREDIKEYVEYTNKKSLTDPLTLLGNRNAYYDTIRNIDAQIKNGERLFFSVIIFDIDDLKQINNRHGFNEGDRLIKVSADIISETFNKEYCFRVGGGEIIVIYPGMDLDTVKNRLLDYNEIYDEQIKEHDLQFKLSICKGYAVYDSKTDKSFASVLARADEMMAKEKEMPSKESKLGKKKD